MENPISHTPGASAEIDDAYGVDHTTSGGTYGGHMSVSGGNESNSIVMGGFAEGGVLGGGKRRKAKSKGRKKSRSRSRKGGAAKRRGRGGKCK